MLSNLTPSNWTAETCHRCPLCCLLCCVGCMSASRTDEKGRLPSPACQLGKQLRQPTPSAAAAAARSCVTCLPGCLAAPPQMVVASVWLLRPPLLLLLLLWRPWLLQLCELPWQPGGGATDRWQGRPARQAGRQLVSQAGCSWKVCTWDLQVTLG